MGSLKKADVFYASCKIVGLLERFGNSCSSFGEYVMNEKGSKGN